MSTGVQGAQAGPRVDAPARLDIRAKAIVLACAIAGYAATFWPTDLLLKWGMQALGRPAYAGFTGAFLPHLLLYTTLTAAACALLWHFLVRAKFLGPAPLGRGHQTIKIGMLAGGAALLLTLSVVWLISPPGTIHWVDPQPWKIAGNLFSNFYEEYIYRGFLLAALTAVFGFWPAALLSSAMWGFLHTQYPLPMQILIVVTGILFCWGCRRARSLWAPYTAHTVIDLVADCLIG
jgi:membrane protease YdiL (CAAX protease family)